MLNIDKQISYWRNSAAEEWGVAQELMVVSRIRHALFFAHLTLEKILKAHVCKSLRQIAPKTHNLLRLAEIAQIELLPDYKPDIRPKLAIMNIYNLEGRYPDEDIPLPTAAEAARYIQETREVYAWLNNQF